MAKLNTELNTDSEAEYGITLLVIGEIPFVPISRDQYQAVRRANGIIVSAVRAEQAFALCIQNYYELEEELLRCSLGEMIYRDKEWQSFAEMRLTLSRRILNLLSAAISYEDQTKATGDPLRDAELGEFKKKLESETLEYRVGRELRNIVLHQDFDISPPTWGSSWDRSLEIPQCGFRTALTLDVERLSRKQGRGQRRELIKDLLSLGGRIDFLQIIRGYVEALGALHERARQLTAGDRKEARETYGYVLAHGEKIGSKSGLDVVARDAAGETLESYYASAHSLDYLRDLERKHAVYQNLSRRYVTSMADVKKKPPTPPGKDAWEE